MQANDEMLQNRVWLKDLHAFCLKAMLKAGIREEDAQLTAEILVTTDSWGTYTHGTKQLRNLLLNFRSGRLDAAAQLEIAAEGPGWASVDAHYAMPPAIAYRSMEIAIQKARATGIGYVGCKHSSHFGAAGYYACMAAQQEMIGISMCNVDPDVTVPGARGKVMGTNPIAYAVPTGNDHPIFLDIATSAVAASKIMAAKNLGNPIPDSWLVDEDGVPTTDPSIFPDKGALLPMAGYKGYGLALMVEILSGVLTGAAMNTQIKSWVRQSEGPTNEGHAFIAIDIGQMMPLGTFKERVDWLAREIKCTPKAKGETRIYMPGEMEWERRDLALKQGMELPEDVVESLRGLAEDVGLSLEGLFC
jgi:LDH2 family malate/lactate/ureidoglycolate dehydrogenase